MEITLRPTIRQHEAYQAWNNDLVDDVVYGGAAGGGKTWWGSEAITVDALRWPNTKYFIGRDELKTLMLTSYITLTQKVFREHKLEQGKHWRLDGKYNVIHFYNGSTVNLLDLAYAPTDPLYDRFGSHEYTRGWIEEASEVAFRCYDVLKSRVGRHMNKEMNIKSKLGITLNPSQDWPHRLFYDPWNKAGRPTDASHPLVSAKFVLDGLPHERTFVFIPALYKDNPYTATEYARNLAGISDPVLKQRLMDGDWDFAAAADTLMDAQSIADLFTNKLPYSNDIYLTVDVARYGGDKIVRTLWRGWDVLRVAWKDKESLTTTADDVRTDIDTYGIPREHVLVDEDGIGGAVVDMVPGVIGFTGGAAPFGKVGETGREVKENYDNLRTQCIYHLAQKTRDRKVAVSEMDMEVRELIAKDLQQFKRRDADKDGKLKATKKEDIKQALGRSPDFGDTMMMRSYFDLREKEAALMQGGTISVYIPD